jgi:putative ABC transport system permease protein
MPFVCSSRAQASTLIAVLALGLGIGANTAIFSVFNGMLWRPLPIKDPQQLVVLAKKTRSVDFPLGLSYPDFQDYRQLKTVFSVYARSTVEEVGVRNSS